MQENVSLSHNPFNEEAYKKISSLSPVSPFAKPINIDGTYYTFTLVKIIPAQVKSFKEAKEEVVPLFTKEMQKEKLLALANHSVKTFKGDTTDFITLTDFLKIKQLNPVEAQEFLQKLFMSDKKNTFITLKNEKIVLYDILEQKLLTKKHIKNDTITKIKNSLFNEGLIKTLQQKYQTEIFIKGL
jgi:peptidyl-prolyl cis-trans isomerase D